MTFEILLPQFNNNNIPFNFVTSKELEKVVDEAAPSEERYTDKFFQADLQIIGHFNLSNYRSLTVELALKFTLQS